MISKIFMAAVLALGVLVALAAIIVILLAIALWITDRIEARRNRRTAQQFTHRQRRFEG